MAFFIAKKAFYDIILSCNKGDNMDFDKLKENNGVYLYEDNSFNTI